VSQTEIKKIKFLWHNFPDSKKCQYCDGENTADRISFEVTYKEGSKEIVCPVCLYEYSLERAKLIDVIKNKGEW